MILPPFITIILSAFTVSSAYCVIIINVISVSLWSFRIISKTSFLEFGESIEVASSRIIISGFTQSIPARASLCFCPPERESIFLFSKPLSPTSESTSSIVLSLYFISWFLSENSTSSLTTVETNWLSGFWNTIPHFCLILYMFLLFPQSRLAIVSSPLWSGISALRCLTRVLLPQPFIPTIDINSPFSILKEML